MPGKWAESVSIRPANANDAELMSTFIVNLAEKFILFEFSERGRAQFLSDHTPAKMRERINGNFRYHLAEADHELVGLAGIRDNAHLFHLFVAESLQCQGLGRRLWEYAVAECRKESNSGIFTVNSSKNAVAAYERLGFSVTGPMQNMNDVLFVPMQLAFL